MHKIRKIEVTLDNGQKKTYEGKGSLYEVSTGVKQDGKTTLDPLNYVEISLEVKNDN